jgi:cellulose synthase/poly-beta-1,6-N-acetylglucosamine synthase-like glycosyltransferase
MKIVFIISIALIFYVLFGYGILAYIYAKIKSKIKKKTILKHKQYTTSLIVAAYNEEKIIFDKFHNCMMLDYDSTKIQFIFVVDGSTDKTYNILRYLKSINKDKNISILYKPVRNGKTAAINRAIKKAKNDILIFTDANTMLNINAVNEIIKHYDDLDVGAVAGEKRVKDKSEGLYWKYESTLKKIDTNVYSTVGAAGELFSIRKFLYKEQPNNTILDDLMISMEAINKRYKIEYEPNAYAIEEGSLNLKEELKRKVRIAAGGIQAITRLKKYLLPISIFNIQFVSRKVLRWTLMPIAIILVLISNVYLAIYDVDPIWDVLLITQIFILYISSIIYLINPKTFSIFHASFYFLFMHYAIILGWIKYAKGIQTGAWEKAKRK